MASFRQQYKCKTFGFANVGEARHIRAEKKEESRKKQRATTFNENRNTSNSAANTPGQKEMQVAPVVEDRMTRLLKWKADRERRKNMTQIKKKPPFVVGVVHHKVYSPLNKDEPVAPTVTRKKVCNSTLTLAAPASPVKRVTRATEKRLKNKALAKEQSRIPVKTSHSKEILGNEQISPKKQNQSFAPTNHKFQAPVGLNHMPLFGRVAVHSMSPARMSKLMSTSRLSRTNNKSSTTEFIVEDAEESPKSPLQEPVFFSPYVVSSRGKSNARKEQKIKRGFSLGASPREDIPTKETVMKNLNISVEEEERTSQYFQFLLNREIERLNDLCKKWTEIQGEPETTEDGRYEINQAIGQTNLLINKKFERFRGLVADCETGKGEMLVTCKDLQGFWDMMYMEVKNCDSRFEKLEKLRSQDWVEEEIPIDRPVAKKKTAVKKKVVPKKTSSIKNFLAERKKKMAQEMRNNDDMERPNIDNISSNKYEQNASPSSKYKMRRSLSIGPNENKGTPVKPNKRISLLQKVQLSETSKKIKSPLTIIKVSQMCKTPEVHLDDTISYINSDQTPGKSILKHPKSLSQLESQAKSTNKVNFDDHIVLNEIPVDEETQTRLDLAAALSRIDSFNLDNPDEAPIKAERKLVFDDNSSDESELDVKQHSGHTNSTNETVAIVPSINVLEATPLQKSESIKSPSISPQRRSLRRQNAVDEDHRNPGASLPLNVVPTPLKEITDDKDSSVLKQKGQKHVSIRDKEETSEHDESIRVLRNRTISSIDTPKAMRRSSRKMSVSVQESEQKENKTPSDRRRKKSSLKFSTNVNEKMDLSSYVDNLHLEESNDRRRSTRSVKFAEKECSGCLTGKPALPMTPHVRRSKAHIIEKKKRSTVTEDLISWDTPEKPPERIRRSEGRKV